MGFLSKLLGFSKKKETISKKNPSGESRQPRNENAVKLLECGGFFESLLHQEKYLAKSEYIRKREEYAPTVDFFSVLKSSGMLEDFCKKNELPLCGYPMQFKYKKAYGLRLYICSNEPEICGFMTNDIHGGKMAIQKCDKCRDGYLIVKHSQKTGFFLGCTNYLKNGTGCDKSIGMKYYYDQMGYSMEEDHSSIEKIQASSKVPEKSEISQKKQSYTNKEFSDEYVVIQRANVKPVMFGEKDLNDVVFTIVKALQNMSKDRFYGAKVLADILSGTESEKVVKNKLYLIPEFSALSDMSYDTIQSTIDWMIKQHLILKTKESYPVLHSTYDGLHYSEFITEGKLKKLKQFLEEDIVLWKYWVSMNFDSK